MSSVRLPTLAEAHKSLCDNGEITGISDFAQTLEGFLFDHPAYGMQTVSADPRILKTLTLHLNDPVLKRLLQSHGANVQPMSKAVNLLKRAFKNRRQLIWGVSGYASGGFKYHSQAKIMSELYKHLAKAKNRPAFIVDGGGKAGVLGLSGVIAKQFNLATVGIVPYVGLKGLAWRTHTLVCEKTFHNREKWVARMPDILMSVQGGEGTMREREEAVKNGTIIFDLIPHAYDKLDTDKLVVCHSIQDIPRCLKELDEMARDDLKANREHRAKFLPKLLAA